MAIKDNVTWETYVSGQFGFGMVSYRDKSEEKPHYDANTIFSHKLNVNGNEVLTPEQALEVKTDCDALVKLLKKFYHEKDFVE